MSQTEPKVEKIHRDKLQRDEKYNPRNKSPRDRLKRDIESKGVNNELIVRKVSDNQYLIGDGWQRFQAGIDAEIEEFECKVFIVESEDDIDNYISEIYSESLQREWTTFEHIRFTGLRFEEYVNERGMSESDAIDRISELLSKNKRTVKRYKQIWSLPRPIRLLVKERNNITEEEWEFLSNYKSDIKERYNRLSLDKAEKISKEIDSSRLSSFTDNSRDMKIALESRSLSESDAKEFIEKAFEQRERNVSTILDEVKSGTTSSKYRINFGSIEFDEDEYQKIMDYIGRKRINKEELAKEAILSKVKLSSAAFGD